MQDAQTHWITKIVCVCTGSPRLLNKANSQKMNCCIASPILWPKSNGQPHLSAVRVRLLGVDASVLLHVVEGVGHVSAAATVVLLDTVHQVLGTEVHQFLCGLGQLALQSSGRAEGPAGAAGALKERGTRLSNRFSSQSTRGQTYPISFLEDQKWSWCYSGACWDRF